MKDIIKIYADADHSLECSTNIIGRAGECEATQFEITLTNDMCNSSVYLDFEKPNGEPFRTPRLTVVNNIAVYDVPKHLLNEEGEIKIQLVLENADGGVWKSTVKKYTNLEGVSNELY